MDLSQKAYTRGRSLRGERLRSLVPQGHWKTTTFVAGLRLSWSLASFKLDGTIDSYAFHNQAAVRFEVSLAKPIHQMTALKTT